MKSRKGLYLRIVGCFIVIAIPVLLLFDVFHIIPPATEAIITQHPTEADVPEPEIPKEFTLAATGDLLIHGGVYNAAQTNDGWDFNPMFRLVASFLQEADIAVCHVETPFSIDNTNLSSYPSFNVPNQMADAIADSGYDVCSLASNHATDTGAQGIEGTITALDRVGVRHTGMARSVEEAEKITMLTVYGFRIAFLSYTYGLNHGALRPGFEYQTNVIEESAVLERARQAKEAGADFVVLSLHWGNEYNTTPSAYQMDLAEIFMASEDVDVILGHHAHVIQPIKKINGKYVVYGMGNFLSGQYPSGCNCPINVQDGVIVYLTIGEDENGKLVVKKVEHLPTHVQQEVYTIIPATLDSYEGVATLEGSAERTKEILERYGVPVPLYGSEPVFTGEVI